MACFAHTLPLKLRLYVLTSLGVVGGVPYMLTASTLTLWMRDFNMSLKHLGLLSLLHLPYGLKFLWAPFFDTFYAPVGKRSWGALGWIVGLQYLMALCVLLLGWISPVDQFSLFLGVAFGVSFLAASHDLISEAFQREWMPAEHIGLGEASCVTGFRLGIIVSSAGALWLSQHIAWSTIYASMAVIMCIITTIMVMILPKNLSFTVEKTYQWWQPLRAFGAHPYGMVLILMMIFYRGQHFLWGHMPSIFLLDQGYSKQDIAYIFKTFGVITAIGGGFFAGWYLKRHQNYIKIMAYGLLGMLISGGVWAISCYMKPSTTLLYSMIFIEEMTRGFAMTAFFSYQLISCHKTMIKPQLAFLTAISSLSQTFLGSLSGYLAHYLGWTLFFFLTSVGGVYVAYKILYLHSEDPRDLGKNLL